MDDAAKRRKEWGDKPCDHKSLDKEYHLGSATGDFVCKQCGRSGWGEDWPKKEVKNNKATITECQVKEAKMNNKLREIEVERYGSYGYKPKEKHLCPYNGEESCESSSGGSLCGGNYGIKTVLDREFVLCAEEKSEG